MQINVAQLLRSPVGTERDYRIEGSIGAEGEAAEMVVWGGVNLLRTPRSVLAKCRLTADTELTCSRCLSLFHLTLKVNIEEEYLPTVDVVSGSYLPPPEEPGTFTIDEHHILDLTEAVRQYVLMALPMKPLCREDCAGLCPQCGRNLNEGPCGCPVQDTDPRWSALRKLR